MIEGQIQDTDLMTGKLRHLDMTTMKNLKDLPEIVASTREQPNPCKLSILSAPFIPTRDLRTQRCMTSHLKHLTTQHQSTQPLEHQTLNHHFQMDSSIQTPFEENLTIQQGRASTSKVTHLQDARNHTLASPTKTVQTAHKLHGTSLQT